jgi:hypothetical protein
MWCNGDKLLGSSCEFVRADYPPYAPPSRLENERHQVAIARHQILPPQAHICDGSRDELSVTGIYHGLVCDADSDS